LVRLLLRPVEQSCSSVGSVAKTESETDERNRRKAVLDFVSFHQAAPMIAASIVALGLAISLFALYVVREPLPPQVAPIAAPSAPASTNTPSEEPAPGPSASPAASASPAFEFASYPNHPRTGDRIGTITMPTLKLSWPIYQGTTDAQLAKGVGHYAKSVMPGQKDNAVLSGHRTTVFNKIGQLKRGQLILVKTSAGVFTYKVRSTRIVLKTDRTVIVPTAGAVLTLTTCWPFNKLGATDQAYVVSADLQK
jgi:sortase A